MPTYGMRSINESGVNHFFTKSILTINSSERHLNRFHILYVSRLNVVGKTKPADGPGKTHPGRQSE